MVGRVWVAGLGLCGWQWLVCMGGIGCVSGSFWPSVGVSDQPCVAASDQPCVGGSGRFVWVRGCQWLAWHVGL